MPNSVFPVTEVLARVRAELENSATALQGVSPNFSAPMNADLISLQAVDRVEQTVRALATVLATLKDVIPIDLYTKLPAIPLGELSARLRGEAAEQSSADSGTCDFF